MQYKYLKEEIEDFENLLDIISKKNLNLEEIYETKVSIQGCTDNEIYKLERFLPDNLKLPAAYKEFLSYGGKKMNGIHYEIDFSYDLVYLILRTKYKDVYRCFRNWVDDSFQLPEDFFVIFLYNSNDCIYYIKLIEGDNPPVYYWADELEGGLEKSVKEYESFSDFIKEQIRIHKYYISSFLKVEL